MRRFLYLLCLPIAVSSGCARPRLPTAADMPFVYKIDVQQGNVISQEMLGQLRRGMDKKQVRFIMGTPIVTDTFHADRWDYIYTFHQGGGNTEQRHVALVFVDEKLDHVTGDIKPAIGTLVVDTRQDMTVKVPDEFDKTLFEKLKDSIPFTGDTKEPSTDDIAASDRPEGAADPSAAKGDEPEKAKKTHEGIVVPEKAPIKKKGFFRRMLDKIGIGGDDSDTGTEQHRPDPKYRDPTNPDDL